MENRTDCPRSPDIDWSKALQVPIPISVYFWNQERVPRENMVAGTVVVVYHSTIEAIGQKLLKKFWPMVIGSVLRTAGSSII